MGVAAVTGAVLLIATPKKITCKEFKMGIGGLGVPELLIILVIVLVVFGASRLTDIMGAMGQGIKEFRKASKDEDDNPKEKEPVKK